MRNAVLPSVSPNYDFGQINHELQLFSNEYPPNNISEFCMDAMEFNNKINKDERQSTDSSSFPIYKSNFVTYELADFPSSTAIYTYQQPLLLGSKIVSSHLEILDFSGTQNVKKRSIDVHEISPIGELIGGERKLMSLSDSRPKSKLRSPSKNRKSQKLAHKISSLQRIVAPYGKTDIASVLQEASLYIQLLQEQIQNLFRILISSTARNTYAQETREARQELRRKGLCLVPISVTEKVSFKKPQIDIYY